MRQALQAAERFRGQTAPNPPVGCVLVDEDGQILLSAAHERAGQWHAERQALQLAKEQNVYHRVHTLVVTLEPCCHFGKTPPCTEAILQSPARQIVIGTRDINPIVAGQGVNLLQSAGLQVIEGVLEKECQQLIEGFSCLIKNKRPFITVKQAIDETGSMIPPQGQKTFTNASSLRFAHQLRKYADAIITGSGTILADRPQFTVRYLPDHADLCDSEKPELNAGNPLKAHPPSRPYPVKKRQLMILDRRRQVPQEYIQLTQNNGFKVSVIDDLRQGLHELYQQGALEVLIEAGPTVTEYVKTSKLWDKWVLIKKGDPDQIVITYREDES